MGLLRKAGHIARRQIFRGVRKNYNRRMRIKRQKARNSAYLRKFR